MVGSYGWGEIKNKAGLTTGGNTILVFKGDGSHLTFTENGELWGGSSGDNVSPITGKCDETDGSCLVDGDRLLSFEGFTGDLSCTRIRDFSSFLMKDSKVGLTGVNQTTEKPVDMSGIENWTFEKSANYSWEGAMLSGNFLNDFEGDTLNLVGFTSGTYAIMKDTDTTASTEDVFTNFGQLSSLKLNGVSVEGASFANNAWTWGSNHENSLAIVGSVMQLTIA